MNNFVEERLTEAENLIVEACRKDIQMAPRFVDDSGVAHYESAAFTLTKVFDQSDLQVERAAIGDSHAEINENAFEVVLPTIVLTASFLLQNPLLYDLFVSVLSDYVIDKVKGVFGGATVRSTIVVKNEKTKTKFKYRGPAKEYRKALLTLRELNND